MAPAGNITTITIIDDTIRVTLVRRRLKMGGRLLQNRSWVVGARTTYHLLPLPSTKVVIHAPLWRQKFVLTIYAESFVLPIVSVASSCFKTNRKTLFIVPLTQQNTQNVGKCLPKIQSPSIPGHI